MNMLHDIAFRCAAAHRATSSSNTVYSFIPQAEFNKLQVNDVTKVVYI